MTHGMSRTRIYKIFRGILNRCNNPSMRIYPIYGGRGIKCLRENFNQFYHDMGEEYEEHVAKYGEKETTIDRIDPNGNYCKENCRWATNKEQGNNMRTNIRIKYNGKKYQSIMQLCERLGINYNTLYKRVFIEGQNIDNAIFDIKNKRQTYKYKGIMYRGITDMCRRLGLNRTSITYRLSVGMSLEDAIEKPITKVQERDKNGKIKKSLINDEGDNEPVL